MDENIENGNIAYINICVKQNPIKMNLISVLGLPVSYNKFIETD